MFFAEMIMKSGTNILDSEIRLNFEVNRLRYNSKLVEPGDVFFAIRGLKTDGNKYINDAIKNGARAVISDTANGHYEPIIYHVPDCRKTLAEMSNAYYDFPSHKMKMTGVTGTNGKTTISSIINFVLELNDKKTGLIGTNGNYINKRFLKSEYTTPESLELNELLDMMYKEGVEYVTMEVSSHALAMKRVYGLEFDIAVFTNLTPEHLDFHNTIEEYFDAKKTLFDSMKKINLKNNKTFAIYNSDDKYGREIVSSSESERISYGFGSSSYSIDNLDMTFDGMNFDMRVPLNGEGKSWINIETKLIGKFNVYNILAAVAALKSLGIKYDIIRQGISEFAPVEGRFNQIRLSSGAIAIIDYSHTPDSLLKALTTIKEIMESGNSTGRIITVFGCGGDRDKKKRPVMGEIAVKYSNETIITSDNPRTEDPVDIIEDIKAGIKSGNYKIEDNREKAIELACKEAKEGDIILVAGKGHETYQEIMGIKYHLSDKEIVQKFI
ncbi:MAG: UDP-N-acetylmuramoyl-L-alanyl-D-glutamate--2,6-diaminopimelate ligase [Ignavibacteriae bacterium]|nr:MAG: UDP-N-acetylmuramoyl-L-alanyl-D-glutamate--2,6-diaminopimelate ligase [Ignavibacteriota bacterium]